MLSSTPLRADCPGNAFRTQPTLRSPAFPYLPYIRLTLSILSRCVSGTVLTTLEESTVRNAITRASERAVPAMNTALYTLFTPRLYHACLKYNPNFIPFLFYFCSEAGQSPCQHHTALFINTLPSTTSVHFRTGVRYRTPLCGHLTAPPYSPRLKILGIFH